MVSYTFDPKEVSTYFLHCLKSEVCKGTGDLMKVCLWGEGIGMCA